MKTINQVYQSTDYAMFKTVHGNRRVNKIHIQRLKQSFNNQYLLSPIIVNELYEIIDGQHRFEAAKSLNLPVNYIVVAGYGLKEVQILNANMKNWSKEDYLQAFCDLGHPEYLKMKKFMIDFPDFGIAASEYILTNSTKGVNNKESAAKIDGKSVGRRRNFQEGNLIIDNLDAAYDNAGKIMMFKPYYDGYNRSVFVSAMITLLKHENYDHDQMIGKLRANPKSMVHCGSITQYKSLIEEIYNYRSRNKVSLIY